MRLMIADEYRGGEALEVAAYVCLISATRLFVVECFELDEIFLHASLISFVASDKANPRAFKGPFERAAACRV